MDGLLVGLLNADDRCGIALLPGNVFQRQERSHRAEPGRAVGKYADGRRAAGNQCCRCPVPPVADVFDDLKNAFAENGVRVPDDVSIVGFDDIEGSDYFLPPLTTVRQDFTALALMSMEVLMGAMEGQEVDRTPIAPTLVVRNSSTQATSRTSPRA